MTSSEQGWAWFEVAAAESDMHPADVGDVADAYARWFLSPDGCRVLAHLKTITVGRALDPRVSDATLRHLEGQRQLVLFIEALVERGRADTTRERRT